MLGYYVAEILDKISEGIHGDERFFEEVIVYDNRMTTNDSLEYQGTKIAFVSALERWDRLFITHDELVDLAEKCGYGSYNDNSAYQKEYKIISSNRDRNIQKGEAPYSISFFFNTPESKVDILVGEWEPIIKQYKDKIEWQMAILFDKRVGDCFFERESLSE